jgi:hypothetical protein
MKIFDDDQDSHAFQFFMFEKGPVDNVPSLVKAIGDLQAAILKHKDRWQTSRRSRRR